MKKVYIIPNVITAFSLACGLFVIFKTSIHFPGQDLFALLQSATILILIAAMADVADGAIARLMKAESEFGGQFDSLADAVTFGVAPPLLVLKSLSDNGNFGELHALLKFVVVIAAMIYALCGVLRLVRYNVNRSTAKEQLQLGNPDLHLSQRKHFTGLPIPAAAAAIVSITLILISPMVQERIFISQQLRGIILSLALMFIGYFMVSRWKFPSLSALHFRVPSFYLIFATGIVTVLVLYGILDYFALVLFVLSWLYLLIAWTLSFIRVLAGKRSKTLLEFEPEEENEDNLDA